jgi:serine phosphatase RsbU (regulator of sigma subunit)
VLFVERNDDERFATVAMVSLSPDLRHAEVLSCGHPAPLLVQHGDIRPLRVHALPMLTMLEERTLEPVTEELGDEWGLLLFTDGLVEGAEAPGSVERFGVGGLTRALGGVVADGVPRSEVAPTLLADAERAHGGPLTDDVAVLLIGTAGWWR